MPSIYTVKVNGRISIVTDVLPYLFARVHDLRNAAGPVTVEEDGREMSALEVEELMLAYHAGRERAAVALPAETPESLLSEAKALEERAARKEVLSRQDWCSAPEVSRLQRDAEIFREEAASKRRRAARLSGVASY